MKVTNIVWCTDGADIELPTEVELPDDMASCDEDDVSDYLSDKFGYFPDTWGDITDSSDTRKICVTFEVTARHSEFINVPLNVNNSEVEDWLERHGELDKIKNLTEEDAHDYDFDDYDYAIIDEKGRDIKIWR